MSRHALRAPARAASFVQQSQEGFANFGALVGERRAALDSLFGDFAAQLRRPAEARRAYAHPLDDAQQGVNFEYGKVEELWLDMVGPEQVSPHYENFLMSRKLAVGVWGTLFASSLLANTRDFAWLVQSSFIPFMFFASTAYFFYEGRKALFLPMLNTFYFNVINQELEQLEREVPHVESALARENVRRATEQMEYLELHRDFQRVKAESVSRFVAHEQLNLREHVHARAQELLTSARGMEARNRAELLSGVLRRAVDEVERLQRDVPPAVVAASFDAALDGIASGAMDYKRDIVLSLVLERVRGEVAKLAGLSAAEQQRLLTLSQAQLDALRSQDAAAREAFLARPPLGIDGSVRALDNVKEMYAKW